MSKLCLTSTGRGRIEHAQGRHVFSYQSLWKPEEINWSLAFSLPVIGQEILSLEVKEESPLRLSATGTFANRLKNDVKSLEQRRLLKQFYGAVGRFLLVVKNPERVEELKNWSFRTDSGELLGEYKMSQGVTFNLRAFDLGEKYGRLQFVLRAKKKMSLDLFVSQCSL